MGAFDILREKDNRKIGLWQQDLTLGLLQLESFINDFQNRIYRIDFDPFSIYFSTILKGKNRKFAEFIRIIFRVVLVDILVLAFECPILVLCSHREVD